MFVDKLEMLWEFLSLDWGVVAVTVISIVTVLLLKFTNLANSSNFRRFAIVAVTGGLAYFRVVFGESIPDMEAPLPDMAEVAHLLGSVDVTPIEYAQWVASWVVSLLAATLSYEAGEKLIESKG
jgi:hypothetical protein